VARGTETRQKENLKPPLIQSRPIRLWTFPGYRFCLDIPQGQPDSLQCQGGWALRSTAFFRVMQEDVGALWMNVMFS